MKVKVSVQSEDGIEWVAEAKDIGLITTGSSLRDALEEMKIEIQNFFANAFGSKKVIEVICSKIKANAAITVSPLDQRPEVPLTSFEPEEPLTISGQDLLETEERLALPPGEDMLELDDSEDPEDGSPDIIDVDFEPVPAGEAA